MTVKFHINQDARPKFFNACPVPYVLQTKVEEELAWLDWKQMVSSSKDKFHAELPQ